MTRKLFILLSIFILFDCAVSSPAQPKNGRNVNPSAKQHVQSVPQQSWENEVFYQIFTRSFYDSNGDSVGDFAGISQKLGYLKSLGVTGIWLTPIFRSRTYHNYFADTFDSTENTFGTNAEFIELVKAVHKNAMKIFIDMETQYIADHHPWYQLSKKDSSSQFAYFLWHNDSSASPVKPFREAFSFDNRQIPLFNLDLSSPALFAEQERLYTYWADPNGDGIFEDGVDGFRIDHMMDDLDNKGENVHLNKKFWKPLFDHLRSVNPKIFILAEQSDWGYGADQLTNGDADAVFTIPLRFDLTAWNKAKILNDIKSAADATPAGKYQFTVIENHDVDRFASAVAGNLEKQHIGAVINITLKGVPCLYYGQEIGMRGSKGHWKSDGNDIPLRQAFRWYRTGDGAGMALWYANSGPWWSDSTLRENEGISLEGEQEDPSSLWNYYRMLIAMRKSNPALSNGDLSIIPNNCDSVISYGRSYRSQTREQMIAVVINLSDSIQHVNLDMDTLQLEGKKIQLRDMLHNHKLKPITSSNSGSYNIKLAGHEILMIEVGKTKR